MQSQAFSGRPTPRADVRQLQRQAEDLVQALRQLAVEDAPGPEGRTQRALRQLLRGCATEEDLRDLGAPVEGARVCALQLADPPSRRAAVSLLRSRDRIVIDTTSGEDEVVFLVPDLPRRVGAKRSRDIAMHCAVSVQHLTGVGTLGVSSALRGAECGPRAHKEAAALSTSSLGVPAAFADDLWCDLAVDNLRQQVCRTLLPDSPLRRLVEWPEAKALDLAVSVATWLDEGGDTRRAAERLYLHPNTLRYRLRRAEALCDIDLGDPDIRMLARLLLPQPNAPQVAASAG